jgi:myo-inositol-1(or 4)-monophosphatase
MAKEILPRPKVLHHKKFGEPVTEGDIRVEEYVISSLKKLFPDHGFDSEERGQENIDAEYVWILDPIDGTKYYAKDVPLYSVSLALVRNKQLVLGIVYSPELGRMYCASTGRGATLNDRGICCSDEKDLNKASICLEIPSRSSSSGEQQWALGKMSMLIERAYRVRIIGVGSLGLCFCAMGGFDAYVNLGCIWKYCDNAAGQVIVQEAGGEFFYAGVKKRQIVAGPKALCDEIRAVLKI